MIALETATGNPLINIGIFGAFVIFTLLVVIRVTRQSEKKAGAFYTGGASFSGRQNGLAITGDYLSAAAFLGVTGAIAVYGYDGLLYSVGFFIAILLALYLVAEPLRNTGKYTMADVLSFRMMQKPVRTAAALSTLTVSLVYLLAQMAGAGGLVALLLGVKDPFWQAVVIAGVGLIMMVYVLIGGMKGFVRQVEFTDGRTWIPSRASLEGARLLGTLEPSPEEQRLTELYRRKGLHAVLDELKKF